MSPQPAGAARRSASAKDEPALQQPNVTESAEARESLDSRMQAIEGAQEGFAHSIKDMDERMTSFMDTVEVFVRDTGKQSEETLQEVRNIERRVATLGAPRGEIKEVTPLVGNIITKNARRVGRFVRRGRPTQETLPAIVMANVTEYAALVAAAQIWPVRVGNAVTAALFL